MSNKPVHERDIADITVEQIMALEAGPELDYLVARMLRFPITRLWQRDAEGRGYSGVTIHKDIEGGSAVWSPSTDANDALVVWRALPMQDVEDYWIWWLAWREADGMTSILWCKAGDMGHMAVAASGDFCIAVCRVYLWAMKQSWGMPKGGEICEP